MKPITAAKAPSAQPKGTTHETATKRRATRKSLTAAPAARKEGAR